MKQLLVLCLFISFPIFSQMADKGSYLKNVKADLSEKWPNNHTVNLVFHGHSVPAGYWHNSEVHTLDSYPQIVLEKVKEKYPLAVINVIVTAIGGENALKGATRMNEEVLNHKPDILFIDYALNDMWQNIDTVRQSWESMIEMALNSGTKVILLTPSPDQRENILKPENRLVKHAVQIKELAHKYHIGLADPFFLFQKIVEEKGNAVEVMSHVNHPNRAGHELIAGEILEWF